jgi:heme-degrading monooxygenase HmoA
MFARTSMWAGSPEAIGKWVENAETRVRGFVEGLPGNAGVFFLVDRQSGTALTLTLWDTAASAEATDRFAEQSRASTVEATGTELTSRGSFEVVAQG